MRGGIIMKVRYYFLLYLLLFSISCGSKERVNISGTGFLNQLIGVYEGTHDSRTFEVRIAEKEEYNAANGGHLLSVFVFEKDNFSDVQKFLTQYSDVQAYSEAICKYVKENPNKFSGYDLRTSPYMFYDLSVDQIWRWDSSLGALGTFIISDNALTSSVDIQPLEYIDLYEDDEYGIKKIHINSEGKAVKVQFFETGFIKKPWNYLMSGPSLEIRKVSSEIENLSGRYYNIRNQTRDLFEKAGKENRSYCDVN